MPWYPTVACLGAWWHPAGSFIQKMPRNTSKPLKCKMDVRPLFYAQSKLLNGIPWISLKSCMKPQKRGLQAECVMEKVKFGFAIVQIIWVKYVHVGKLCAVLPRHFNKLGSDGVCWWSSWWEMVRGSRGFLSLTWRKHIMATLSAAADRHVLLHMSHQQMDNPILWLSMTIFANISKNKNPWQYRISDT